MFIKHPQGKKTSFDFLTFGKEGGVEGSMLEGVPRDRGDGGRNFIRLMTLFPSCDLTL